ncbi:Glycerol-3-phosphate dehydrogenase [NAD(+)] [Capsicum chinense]|nr:Glycerol-3-phosphate dehydrogenase [NAD(+)] [Capsicum chinense]
MTYLFSTVSLSSTSSLSSSSSASSPPYLSRDSISSTINSKCLFNSPVVLPSVISCADLTSSTPSNSSVPVLPSKISPQSISKTSKKPGNLKSGANEHGDIGISEVTNESFKKAAAASKILQSPQEINKSKVDELHMSRDILAIANLSGKEAPIFGGFLKPVVYHWPSLEKLATCSIDALDSKGAYIFVIPTSGFGKDAVRVVYAWVGRSFGCDISKAEGLSETTSLPYRERDANMLVFVIPHQFMEGICKSLVGKIREDVVAISLIKGIKVKREGPCMISTLIFEILGISCCVLMGANIANKIAVEKFSEATLVYREKKEIAKKWVRLFNTPYWSLIQNQLITHLMLEIVVLAVLDALHVCFWYWGTELVEFVEQVVARTSQAHAGHLPSDASLYFRLMFSGQLTSEAMVGMLAHFKGSTHNRFKGTGPRVSSAVQSQSAAIVIAGGSSSQHGWRFLAPDPSLGSVPATMFGGVRSDGAPSFKAHSSATGVYTHPRCGECGRRHQGVCRFGSDVCFGYGEPGYRMRECRALTQRGRLQALQARLDQEGFPEIDSVESSKAQNSVLDNMPPKRKNQSTPQPEEPLGDHASHAEFRTAFTTLDQSVANQNEQPPIIPANPVSNSAVARIRDFT